MIALDTNILVYAHRQDASLHAEAKKLVKACAEGKAAWAIPFHVLVEFYGIVTHPKIYVPPSTTKEAISQIESWLESPSVNILTEARGSDWDALKGLLLSSKVVGHKVHDARIAALCASWEVSELWSVDRDFSRFSSVRIVNPLK